MGSNVKQWIAISSAIALFCLVTGIYWLFRARGRAREELLKQRLRGQQDDQQGGIQIRRGLAAIAQIPFAGALAKLLDAAGVQMPLRAFATRAGAGIGGAVVLGGVLTLSISSGLVFGLVGVVGIYFYLGRRRDKRIKEFAEALPRAVEMLIFSLRAGNSLEDALRIAGEEVEGPLAVELARVHQETELGRAVEAALIQLRDRWPTVGALRSLVEAITVLKRTGGNLVTVLASVGANLRAQARYTAKLRALTAEGRTSGRILLGIPLVTVGMQIVSAPEQLALLLRGPGLVILIVAVSLWVLGALWVTALTKVK